MNTKRAGGFKSFRRVSDARRLSSLKSQSFQRRPAPLCDLRMEPSQVISGVTWPLSSLYCCINYKGPGVTDVFESIESEGFCRLETQSEVCLSGCRVNIAESNHLIHSCLVIIKGENWDVRCQNKNKKKWRKAVVQPFWSSFIIILTSVETLLGPLFRTNKKKVWTAPNTLV